MLSQMHSTTLRSPWIPLLFATLLPLGCGPGSSTESPDGALHTGSGARPGVGTVERAEQRFYTARNSSRAILTFRGLVEFNSRTAPTPPTSKMALHAIEDQVLHLFGPMGVAKVKAVPKGDHRITELEIGQIAGDRYRASYTYRGTIVLENSSAREYAVPLPINPYEVYDAGTVKLGPRTIHPCTDSHYDSEDDFWYFWNPESAGCPLLEGRDYRVVRGQLERLANESSSYPEYSRMVDPLGRIRISILLGMDNPRNGRDPLRSSDINAHNYERIVDALEDLGFTGRRWSPEELRALLGFVPRPLPFVQEFTKRAARATVVATLFFGPSGINENSRAFHHFFRDALEHAAVVIYDGHSGLGGHLDLESIEASESFRIQPSSGYQIYFFNSCSSYTYFNEMYFQRKIGPADPQGTKNLDILTNGLATYFSATPDANSALLRAIDRWASGGPATSYQELAAQIDSDNLFGVNGDEDNAKP